MLESKVYSSFKIEGIVKAIQNFGKGNINDTYLVDTSSKKYIIQTINKKVFKKPKKLMNNICLVTKWLENKEEQYRGIRIIKTFNNKMYLRNNRKYYRCYEFIEDGYSLDEVKDLTITYEMGKSLGRFQENLNEFPCKKLYKIIPNFHNANYRFLFFKKTVKKDKCKLRKSVLKEIHFILKRKKYFDLIDEKKDKDIRTVVTHNDPKYNNILINKETKKEMCLIDLDTVMPGTVLYDFGDALRSIIICCDEDEADLNKVDIDINKFESFTKGYLDYQNKYLTEKEKSLLVESVIVITLECGMRFLTDYLNGNVYFKVSDPMQNLRRARVALKEVYLLEKNKYYLKTLIN